MTTTKHDRERRKKKKRDVLPPLYVVDDRVEAFTADVVGAEELEVGHESS